MPTAPSTGVLVVGAGTAGSYAAATVAEAGYDVTVLERKSADEAGHIACGDAIKGADSFPDPIPKSTLEPAITNPDVDHGRFEIPQENTVLEIPVPGELAVVDRFEYGKRIIDAARDAGATFQFDTVVNDVLQDDGRVTGVTAKQNGTSTSISADVVIDASGALSLLQDRADLSETTFDTNVTVRQFTSAYREIVEVPEPIEWDDALVFKPTDRAAGYLWYFPRTPTEINVGLGFQMTEDPMQLVDALKRDLQRRPEFDGATVTDKLGAALPTRRPYDSAVAPGFMAVGDAAGHVNPTTGGGIAGAAYAGTYAAEAAIDGIESGSVREDALWSYNERFMDHFGTRYAGLDVYNILFTAVDVDELMGLLASIPAETISEALYSGTTEFGWPSKIRTLLGSLGYWGLIRRLYRTKRVADRLIEHYESYPDSPAGLPEWQSRRDAILDDVYDVTGADPKY
ncbi:MAG: geranylgeranyl reductase family protein [Halodesulfurarchaeum sp.]